jgi:hypothetical protein
MMVGLAVVVIKNPHPDIKIVVPLVTCGIGVATVFTFAGKGVLDYSEYKKEKEKHMSSQELMNVVDDSTRYEPLEYTTL